MLHCSLLFISCGPTGFWVVSLSNNCKSKSNGFPDSIVRTQFLLETSVGDNGSSVSLPTLLSEVGQNFRPLLLSIGWEFCITSVGYCSLCGSACQDYRVGVLHHLSGLLLSIMGPFVVGQLRSGPTTQSIGWEFCIPFGTVPLPTKT